MALRLQAIALRLEAIALRLEAIALRLEAVASRFEAIASRLEAVAFKRFLLCALCRLSRHAFMVMFLQNKPLYRSPLFSSTQLKCQFAQGGRNRPELAHNLHSLKKHNKTKSYPRHAVSL